MNVRQLKLPSLNHNHHPTTQLDTNLERNQFCANEKPMNNLSEFSNLLNQYLEKTNYSLGQLAKRSSLPKRTIANWSRGVVKKPRSWRAIVKIANALYLTEENTNALLRSADHLSVQELLTTSNQDNRIREILEIISQRQEFQASGFGSGKQFGDLLSEYVVQKDLTSKQLSKLTNIAKPTIDHWLAGHIKKPRNWLDIVQLGKVLRLSEAEISLLLKSAGHPPIQELVVLAQTTQEKAIIKVLSLWVNGSWQDKNTEVQTEDNQQKLREKENDQAKNRSDFLQDEEATISIKEVKQTEQDKDKTDQQAKSASDTLINEPTKKTSETRLQAEPPSTYTSRHQTSSFRGHQTVEFEKQVREACKHYNKPERIGKLPIASLALQAILLENPSYPTDLVGRGQALQTVIKGNLLKLEPEEKHSRDWEIYLCLSCYIFQRAYSSNIKLKNVQVYIEVNYQIPKATYNYRLKKEGIPQLSYLISTYLSQQLTWIEPIPQIAHFIGRENEQAYYHQQLEKNNVAVIQGVGGIGKTTLAAQLASSIKNNDQRAVCWITLRIGLNDSAMDILYAWAVIFAQHDYPQLWAFMRATATEEKRLPEYYPILREGLAKVKPLLCIDNLELLPKSEERFWELLSIVQQETHTNLLLISQQRPLLSNLDDYHLLSGLPRNQVRDFLAQREVELTDDQLDRVVNYTNGNLRLLDLWAAYVKQQAFDIPTSLERLLSSAATGAFLTNEVINALTVGQKQAARLLAFSRLPLDSFILQEPPRHLAPLSDLDIENNDFERLQKLGLIQQQSGKQWSVSPLLKDYLNSNIVNDRDDITDLHEWLANLYLSQSNIIESAYHLIKADEAEQAVLLLSKQQQTLIEQGQASALGTIFNLIEVDNLSSSAQEVLRHLRIELWLLLGNYQAVKENALAAEKIASTDITKAHAIQIQAEVGKRRGYLAQASESYREALETLLPKQMALEVWLRGDFAWIQAENRQLHDALYEIKKAEIALEKTKGSIFKWLNDFEKARYHYERAAKIASQSGERRELMRVQNNLGLLYLQQGQLKKAIAIYKHNLTTIEESSEFVGKAITLLNLALCYSQLNQLEMAIQYTIESLSMFEKLGDQRGLMLAHQNLANQYFQIAQLDKAKQHVMRTINVDEDVMKMPSYPEGFVTHAKILLAENKPHDALKEAEKAFLYVRDPNKEYGFGNLVVAQPACETLARIHTALGNMAEAEKYEALAKALADKLKQ